MHQMLYIAWPYRFAMEVQDVLQRLEQSDVFKKWKTQSAASFLSTMFAVDEGKEKVWQVGYYDPQADMMTTFLMESDIAEKVFKTQEMGVQPLELHNVLIDADAALASAAALQQKKYPGELSVKRIIILQHLDMGQVYNITYVTRSFKTLNIKVDAKTGAVVQDHLVSLVQFDK